MSDNLCRKRTKKVGQEKVSQGNPGGGKTFTCHVAKLVNEGFCVNGGRIRGASFDW